MDKGDLKSLIASEISDASGYVGGDLSDQRSKSLDYYLGEPFGNEREGYSKVVSRDLAETVEWLKPSLLKTFAASEQAVRFEAEGPEDEDQADQETDYCNYVFYRENEGFLILYTWFTDALLQKNGIIKIYWDESEKSTRESYKGLDDDEFMKLMDDPELSPVEHNESNGLHDIVFRRTKKIGKVKIDPVPPEEFLINRDHNSLSMTDAAFVAHKTEIRVSDLISMGYDRALIESLPADDGAPDTYEETARKHLSDEYSETNRNDKSMRKIRVYECYIRVDYDDDGIAELRKVTYAGEEILDNEEVDRIPFEAITPIILSHKFHGLSIYDMIGDLQLIKSTLWRQMLDNLYLTNNPTREVAEGAKLDDLLTHKSGGIVRTKVPGLVNNLTIPFVAGSSFPMLEYLDRASQKRTGVSESLMGNNQSILSDTAHGIERLMSAAEAKVELIARIFAETGVKGMFRQIHELLQKHQDKQKVIKLRNRWVPVDPREWRERTNMTIKVGLGTGDRMKMASAVGQILEIQEKIMSSGGGGVLVTPRNIYNAVTDLAKYQGLNDAQSYFTDPSSPDARPPDAGPNVELEKIRAEMQMQQDGFQHKMQAEQIKAQSAMREMSAGLAADKEIEIIRINAEREREAMNLRAEAEIEEMKAQIRRETEISKADIQAQSKILMAEIASLRKEGQQ